jgi:hypothetical protein
MVAAAAGHIQIRLLPGSIMAVMAAPAAAVRLGITHQHLELAALETRLARLRLKETMAAAGYILREHSMAEVVVERRLRGLLLFPVQEAETAVTALHHLFLARLLLTRAAVAVVGIVRLP